MSVGRPAKNDNQPQGIVFTFFLPKPCCADGAVPSQKLKSLAHRLSQREINFLFLFLFLINYFSPEHS